MSVRESNERLERLMTKMSLEEDGVIISCIEAARLLGRTPSTVSAMVKQGRLQKVTRGRSTGIRLSEIRRILNPQ